MGQWGGGGGGGGFTVDRWIIHGWVGWGNVCGTERRNISIRGGLGSSSSAGGVSSSIDDTVSIVSCCTFVPGPSCCHPHCTA